MTLFIVEDDFELRKELITFLEKCGYDCKTSNDFTNIVKDALEAEPDLILLDINLPYFDGYHICREIRKVSDVPIIIVTSRNTDMDELMSMNLGADDFVTKPYNTQILLARINAILKRAEKVGDASDLKYNGLTVYTTKSKVSFADKSVDLTKNELRILWIFIKNQGNIVSRNDLMDELWQSDEFVDDNTLTVNVNRLRKKLEQIGAVNFIQTRRGQGYIL
ncbi:response regulator protein GraR [Anaerotignum neopropionicum]|uniref:Stage 0 sporulation protein A homolog n=1 Tax=Anaerotignum neopropionicum TaxID=36847 RepID=A0A136WDM0_9FIRM|nr:response regulator transcription factor [Anaerotignum neopropionicum]KXL52429.1 response regulator protein GraR [Anaerotignum neopropionicum]